MLFQAVEQQRLDSVLVGHRSQRALGVNPLQFRLLLRTPLPQPFLGPLAPADRLQLLAVALQIQVALEEELLRLVEQAHGVIRELHIEAELLTQALAVAARLGIFRLHLVDLGVGISLEAIADALVQEQFPIVAQDLPDARDVQDAHLGREQAVDHVGIALHAELDVFDDVVDLQIVHPTLPSQRRGIVDMVLLVHAEV